MGPSIHEFNKTSHSELGMMIHTFSLSTQEEETVDVCESEASLVSMVSSRPPKAT